MSEIIVRKMQPEDLSQVCEIEKENFSLPWSEKSFLESMERTDTVFLIALMNEEVAGYVGCYCIAGTGEITNVAVKTSCRRKGIGGKLLEKLYAEGALLDTREFFLEVRESNEAAIGLYLRQGFVKEGIRKNFYEKPIENAVIMWKH
jgi:ribosomal-protein-alanine N-acetyltransferase